MKLSEQILRRPLFVAFGSSQQTGGLTSVDLEATRDDSQVILTASDGSAAPVAGADASTAGVMTAADKVSLDGLPPTTTREFAARSGIPGATVAAAITHLRSAGHTAAGDGGGAVYRRAGAEPAHALKVQSADGAWWELVPGPEGISVRQAGAVGDGVADDSQAFRDALDGVEDFNAGTDDVAVHRVIVPPGHYYLGATTLELKKIVHMLGAGSGLDNRPKPAKLRWDANVTGIIVHNTGTIGATTEGTPTGGAGGSVIEGLELVSDGGTIAGVTDGTKGHGIWLRARAILERCWIHDFPGNGVNIVASSGSGGATEGNANNWSAINIRTTGNHQHGVFIDGADVNAGYSLGIDSSANGRWGIFDSSFLGNTHVAAHENGSGLATKGENGSGESSKVHNNSAANGNVDRRYAANVNATEADLVATEPGTDEGVWIDVGSGASEATIPTWQASQPEGTYFHGGSYHTDNSNARNLFENCYVEGQEAPPQFVRPTVVINGHGMGASKGTYGGFIGEANATQLAGLLVADNHREHAPARDLTLEINPFVSALLKLQANGDHTSGLSLASWDETNGHWTFRHRNQKTAIGFTTDLNTKTFGRSAAADGGHPHFPRGIKISDRGLGRMRTLAGFREAPLTGEEFARGDLMWNWQPSAGTPAGWRVLTGGVIDTDAVIEEFFYLPDLPADRGVQIRPHASNNEVEWRAAPKAGTDTIADTAGSQAVSFTTAFADANYAVALAPDGDERVWISSKTASGFTLNRAGTSGARAVDWTATPHENL